MAEYHFSWKDAIPSVFAGLFFILQMLYGFFLAKDTTIDWLQYISVGVFLLSGYFGMAPVISFPKKGNVAKGKSYVHTTTLVDTGIYAIIRHPQYFSFILWSIGAMLLFQNVMVILLGIPVILLTYEDMVRADKFLINKFGSSYQDYMKKVPRANPFIGCIRCLLRNEKIE